MINILCVFTFNGQSNNNLFITIVNLFAGVVVNVGNPNNDSVTVLCTWIYAIGVLIDIWEWMLILLN